MLTRTTVLTAGQTGKVTVEVPTAATIDMRDAIPRDNGFEFSGQDDFVGLLVTSTDDPSGAGSLRYLAMDLSARSDGYEEFAVTNAPGADTTCGVCPVPAGTYNIYVLTTEAVSLTITLEGLPDHDVEGETPTYEARAVTADFVIPQPLDVDLPGDTARLWSAGAVGEIDGTGALITLYFLEGPPTQTINVIARGSCDYGPDGPPQGIVTPGCAGGDHDFDGFTGAIQSPYG